MKTDGELLGMKGPLQTCKEIVPDTFRTSSLAKEPLQGNHTEKKHLFSSYE